MTEKFESSLYSDVVGHEIYEALVDGLDDDQRAEIEGVLMQFTKLIETGMLKPCADMVDRSRDEVAEDMVADAIKKAEKSTETTAPPEDASEAEDE